MNLKQSYSAVIAISMEFAAKMDYLTLFEADC
jgi:hypothetical protein